MNTIPSMFKYLLILTYFLQVNSANIFINTGYSIDFISAPIDLSDYPTDYDSKSSSTFEVESEDEFTDESLIVNELYLDFAINSYINHKEISILIRNHYSPWRPPQIIS